MRINAIPQYQYLNRNYQSPKHNVQFTGSQELFDAVWNGCIDAAESEIQSGTSINSKSKLYPYNSALMYAIIRGNDKVVEYLVQKPDLDINYQDAKGNTALHNALKDCDVFMTDNIVRMLLDRDDIDATIKNKKGETAWDLYKKHKMLGRNALVEKKLYDKTMGATSPVNTTSSLSKRKPGEIRYTQYDKEAGDLASYLSNNLFVLPPITKLLQEDYNGIKDINGSYKVGGENALMMSLTEEREKDVDYLLSRPDINVNLVNADKQSSLHLAAINAKTVGDDRYVLKLIIRDDIDATIKDAQGHTALYYYNLYSNEYTQSPEVRKILTYKTDNPESSVKKIYTAPSNPISADQLKPENNIYTQEQITDFFIKNLRNEVITEQLLETTPLIILDDKTLNAVMSTMDFELIEKVVDYKRNQTQMLEQYNKKRDEFLAGMKDLPYAELIKSQMVLNTPDGFKNLMDKKEFDPNQKIGNETLFERACKIDTDGTLIKKILIRYDDVFTNNVKSVNPVVQKLIDYYNTTGRYSVKLNNIERDLYDKDKGKMAMQQLKDFVRSEDYNLEITDFVGNSPAHIGATTSFECAKEIIFESMRKGFDINAKNKAGQTPLMLALKTLRRTKDEDERRNIFGIIKFILDKGADVNIQDSLGQSPLHYVCATDSPTALKLILSKNPNIALTDNNGRRARYYLEGKDEMTQIYREYIEA